MICYVFKGIGFLPGGSGRQTCTKIGKRQHKMRNNTQNNIKNRKAQNIQNRNKTTKQNIRTKNIIKYKSSNQKNNKEKQIIMR